VSLFVNWVESIHNVPAFTILLLTTVERVILVVDTGLYLVYVAVAASRAYKEMLK